MRAAAMGWDPRERARPLASGGEKEAPGEDFPGAVFRILG